MTRKLDLAELAYELRTQNNLMTQHPLFVVQKRQRIWGMDSGYSDDYLWFFSDDPEYTFSEDDIRAEIRRSVKDSELLEESEKLKAQDDDIDPEDWGYEQVYYIDIWVHVTAHLTRRAAQRYIDGNKHNMTNPRIYVESQYRCHEWNAVVAWLSQQGARDDTRFVVPAADGRCAHCGLCKTPEGHDGCIGTVPGIMNACCGHGGTYEGAYIQYWDGSCVRDGDAEAIFAHAKKVLACPPPGSRSTANGELVDEAGF